MTQLRRARRIPALLVSVGLSLGLTAGAVALAPASYAQKTTVRDAVGDPVKQVGESEDLVPAPRSAAVDIEKTTIIYRDDVLVVRTEAVKVAKNVLQTVRVRSGGKDELFLGFVGPGSVFGEDLDECDVQMLTLNKRKATYTMKVPTRCFGAPDTVRVGSALARSYESSGDFITSIDDAQRDDFGPRDDLKLTRKIRRG